MSTASPKFTWPLGHAAAHSAATEISAPLSEYPKAQKLFHRGLAGRLVGSVDKADMLRRLDEFSADFREKLPEGESCP